MTPGRNHSGQANSSPTLIGKPSAGSGPEKTRRSVPGSAAHADTGRVNDPSRFPEYDFSEPLLNQDALAAWLAVSPETVKKWVQAGPASGRVPRFYRVNGQIRFRHVDVKTWMEGKAVG